MELYLVQHGLSHSKDEDPAQGLSTAGIAATKKVAEVAKSYQVPVKAIHHSPKKGPGRLPSLWPLPSILLAA